MGKRNKRQRTAETIKPSAANEFRRDEAGSNGNGFSHAADIGHEPAEFADDASFDELLWKYGKWGVLTVAAVLRFAALTLKPFHHDEGVNGFFLTGLFRDGLYKYDPTNYHGPSLYYFGLISAWLLGLNDTALRVVVAVFGLLTVALVFSLRRYLGTVGTIAAAAFIAVSPGMTFFSRYFIHEILLVFFTFAAAVCVLKYIEGAIPGKIESFAMALTLFTCCLPVAIQAANVAVAAENRGGIYVARFAAAVACGLIAGIAVQKLQAWDSGRPMYLFLAAAAAAMTFTTKETSFISLGTMLIAVGCIAAWLKLTPSGEKGDSNKRSGFLFAAAGLAALAIYFYASIPSGINWLMDNYLLGPDRSEQTLVFLAIGVLAIAAGETARRYFTANWRLAKPPESSKGPEISYLKFRSRLRESGNSAALVFGCVIVFAAVAIVFFTSFLTNEKGISDAFEAYNVWTKTGSSDHAQSGAWAYLRWLIAAEAPIFVLGSLGLVIAFWRSSSKLAMFAALWGFGLFAAYTIIPYKTPWIGINFVLPMALAAGYGIDVLASGRSWWENAAAKMLAVLGLAICLFQAVELNFFRFDDERRPYVYVHSKRSMDEMIGKIGEISQKANLEDKAAIIVTSPENWPLPWSLNKYKGAAIYGSVVKTPNAEFVIGSKPQRTDLDRDYSATHAVVGTYALRPGVDLLLYVRKDLIDIQQQ